MKEWNYMNNYSWQYRSQTSPSWKDFGITLKHKKKKMKFEDLIVHLRIQEHHQDRNSKCNDFEHMGKAELIEAKND